MMQKYAFAAVVLMGCAAEPCLSKDAMSGVDYLVEATRHAGESVAVRDCTIVGAHASLITCDVSVGGNPVGSIRMDARSLMPSDLRFALEHCSGVLPVPACRASFVSGTVQVNSYGDAMLSEGVILWKSVTKQ